MLPLHVRALVLLLPISVAGLRVAAPRVAAPRVGMAAWARPAALAKRAQPAAMMVWPWEKAAPKPTTSDDSIAFKDASSLTKEEERRLKLEVGTNWEPRTSTVKGEGYQFFQGPTPKTGVQADVPDFFSSDNFAGAGELGTTPKILIGLGGVLFLSLVAFLVVS